MIKRRTFSLCVMLVFTIVALTPSFAMTLPRDVMGVRLDANEEAMHRTLRPLGTKRSEDEGEVEENGGEEIWDIKSEPRFDRLIVGLNRRKRVSYVTALARDGGRQVRYTEIGDLKKAHKEVAGNFYRYTWEVKSGKPERDYFIIAQGRDPQFLNSLSIKKKQFKEAEEKKPIARPRQKP